MYLFRPFSAHGWIPPSSSISMGCVVPLSGDWAIFCHTGLGQVGRVLSAREKSLHPGIEPGPPRGQTVRYIHSPTELKWQPSKHFYINIQVYKPPTKRKIKYKDVARFASWRWSTAILKSKLLYKIVPFQQRMGSTRAMFMEDMDQPWHNAKATTLRTTKTPTQKMWWSLWMPSIQACRCGRFQRLTYTGEIIIKRYEDP